jgi:ADP-ribose pyrophosphatase YjhB (NUDIX family)
MLRKRFRNSVKTSCKIMQMKEISSPCNNEADAVWRPDVTVATIVARDGRFLIVEENVRGELVLNQPAGHLEPDESLLDAARRETLEETGWSVTIDHLVGSIKGQSHGHFLRFTFAAEPIRPGANSMPASCAPCGWRRRNVAEARPQPDGLRG